MLICYNKRKEIASSILLKLDKNKTQKSLAILIIYVIIILIFSTKLVNLLLFKNMAKIKKILIAEDEKPLSRALSLKLTNEGYEVEAAYDGAEAVEKLKKGGFDLLLLDLIMPKKDGFGVLEERKKAKIKTPVLVLTNLSQDQDKEKVLKLGATDFFIKSDSPISSIVDHVKKFE